MDGGRLCALIVFLILVGQHDLRCVHLCIVTNITKPIVIRLFVRSVDLMKLNFIDRMLFFFPLWLFLARKMWVKCLERLRARSISFHFQNVYHLMIFNDIACLKWPLVRVCAPDPGRLPERKTTYLWTQYIIFNQFSTYLFLISLVHTIPIVITNLAIGYSILSMRIDLESSRFYFC